MYKCLCDFWGTQVKISLGLGNTSPRTHTHLGYLTNVLALLDSCLGVANMHHPLTFLPFICSFISVYAHLHYCYGGSFMVKYQFIKYKIQHIKNQCFKKDVSTYLSGSTPSPTGFTILSKVNVFAFSVVTHALYFHVEEAPTLR